VLGIALLAAFALGFFTHYYGWYETPLHWGTALLREPLAFPGAITTLWRARATLPVMSLEIRFNDYQRLSSLRDRARQSGVHVPFEDEAVRAVMVSNTGQRHTVALRLPGGPATLADGEAWTLELRQGDAGDWLRLIPVDETRSTFAWQQIGYLNALRQEGFAAATHTPVRLEVNGAPWGLYILETPASVEGAVFFDAQAVWEAQAAGEPVAEGGFRYATVASTDALSPTLQAAAAHLRAVQLGEHALSEVCDVASLGRFLALTALWTGQPAPDWRTLRWRYDPATHLLAPVGVAQPARLSSPQAWDAPAPLPEAFYDDPAVQAAYARALTELASPAYLEHLYRTSGATLEQQWLALRTASPTPSRVAPPWDSLERHQRAMRARLAPQHALSATLEPDGPDLIVQLVNLHAFPLHIVGLDAGGAALHPLDPAWVVAADRQRLVEAGDDGAQPRFVLRAAAGAQVHPVRLRLPWHLAAAGGDTLFIVCRLWEAGGPELRIPVLEPAPYSPEAETTKIVP